MNAIVFRANDENHAVLTLRGKLKRGTSIALCVQPFDEAATRLQPFPAGDPKQHQITCIKCSRSFDGFVNTLDTDFGFESRDDGTGRFQ